MNAIVAAVTCASPPVNYLAQYAAEIFGEWHVRRSLTPRLDPIQESALPNLRWRSHDLITIAEPSHRSRPHCRSSLGNTSKASSAVLLGTLGCWGSDHAPSLSHKPDPTSAPSRSSHASREGLLAMTPGTRHIPPAMAGSPLKRQRKLGVRNEDGSVIAFPRLSHPRAGLSHAFSGVGTSVQQQAAALSVQPITPLSSPTPLPRRERLPLGLPAGATRVRRLPVMVGQGNLF